MKPGDIFEIRKKQTDQRFFIQIGKIEILDGEEVIHLSIFDDNLSEIISHAPFLKKDFEQEDISYVKNDSLLSDFSTGYEIWEDYYSQGEAGVFSGRLLEVLVLPDPD